MNVKRILIIASINSLFARRRAEDIASRYEEFTIEHCYPVNIKEAQDYLEWDVWSSKGFPLSYEDLLQTIERKVLDFHPDVILLHTGTVFAKHPQTVLRVLTAIKDKYPQIKIGYQHRSTFIAYLDNEGVFDRDENTKAIEKMMFKGGGYD